MDKYILDMGRNLTGNDTHIYATNTPTHILDTNTYSGYIHKCRISHTRY